MTGIFLKNINYQKPAFWVMILVAIACVMAAVCFLTDPLTAEDYFVLTDSKSPAGSNRLFYEISLGNQAMSGEINELFELWIGGAGPNREPMYIYLKLADGSDMKMDIRDGGVTEFISEYGSHHCSV